MTKKKPDIYQEVTDRIIDALEAGTVPWRKPWSSHSGVSGGPVNVRTGRPYRGINVFLLMLEGYDDPRWGTYNAIKAKGGNVRKGEKGTRVILWHPVKHTDDDGKPDDYLVLRSYVVFNAEQADGLAPLGDAPAEEEFDPIESAQQIVDAFVSFDEKRGFLGGRTSGGPALRHGGDRAAYSPDRDVVYMPAQKAFDNSESYYSTLFHELTHSTGHESRLKRIEPALFGTDPYAREELVAEMGAAMLAGVAGLAVDPGKQSAAYIAGWLRQLKNDRKLVVQAAAAAQKAADLVVGKTFDDEQADETETTNNLEGSAV